MKKAVVTLLTCKKPFTEYTLKSIKEYAKKIDVDYIEVVEYEVPEKYNVISTNIEGNMKRISKLLVIREYLEKYDRIIFLDDSCVVNSDCPDLFNIVPVNFIGANNEGVLEWPKAAHATIDLFNASNLTKNLLARHDYINAGVMVFSKEHRYLLADERVISLGKNGFFSNSWPEQTYLNFLLNTDNVPVFYLPHHFNRMNVHKERQNERINYSNYTLEQRREQYWEYKDFDFLTADHIMPGKTNHAFIWHLTSFWENEPRALLAKRLYEISRNQNNFYTVGLQRSGTNFMSSTLKINFGLDVDLSLVEFTHESWKHRLEVPSSIKEFPVIVVWKHPYHWIESIAWRKQVDWVRTQIKYSNVEEDENLMIGKEGQKLSIIALCKTWVDFYNNWWFSLDESIKKRTVLVKYEDMLRRPDEVLDVISIKFRLEKRFINYELPKKVQVSEDFSIQNISRYDTDHPGKLINPYVQIINSIILPEFIQNLENQSI